jgi:hypothetical protein
VTAAETDTRGSRPGELHRRRVLLLAESAGLAAVLHHLLDPADRLSRIGSLRELTETRALESADVVVLDVPAGDRAGAVDQIRRSYLGPLVVLVARGEDTGWLHVDDAATLLVRPFSAEDLGAALAGPHLPGLWTTEPGRSRDPDAVSTGAAASAASVREAELKAVARQAPVRRAPTTRTEEVGLVERGQRLLIGLTEGWKAPRRVRVAGFSVFTLVAFAVAFALAAQGRCGPGCGALGTGFAPAPTIAPSESSTPPTARSKRTATTTAVRAGSSVTGAFQGISGRLAATTTTEPQASTTTRQPTPGGGGPAPTTPTTGSATTTPTTQPTTTGPPTTPPTTPSTTVGA